MLGIAVLVVAIVALRSPKHASTDAGSATATTSRTGSVPSASGPSSAGRRTSSSPKSSSSRSTSNSAVGSQPLVVLNDTSTPGLAQDAASRFERAGWHVTSTADYSNDILSTVAYYDPTVSGAKQAALALQKQFPTIKRVVERFPELPEGPVVVVLTTDYSSS